jgi:hypothetical protein
MKTTSIASHAVSLELRKALPAAFSNQKTTKKGEGLSNEYVRPTEELISRLNRIGQEYPFCVYYKEKTNDPL